MSKKFNPDENLDDLILHGLGQCKDLTAIMFVLLLAPILYLCQIWDQYKKKKRIVVAFLGVCNGKAYQTATVWKDKKEAGWWQEKAHKLWSI